MTSTEEAVSLGVAMLDEHRPYWADKIDVMNLEMSLADSCILGQLYGGYDTGMLLLHGRVDDEWALEHGFTFDVDSLPTMIPESRRCWQPLTDAWVRVIEERQQPDWTPSQVQGSQHEAGVS